MSFPTTVPETEYRAYSVDAFNRGADDLDRDAALRRQRTEAELAQQVAAPRQFSPFDEVFRRYAGPLGANDEFMAILAAGTRAESQWNPNAVGDNGRSVGLFQMHEAGAGAGLSHAQRADPDFASSRMVPAYAAAYQQIKAANPTLQGPELASLVAATAERHGQRAQLDIRD